MGFDVDVFTRRDSPELPEVVDWLDGVRVIHVTAGPAKFMRKEEMLPYMGEFTRNLIRLCRHQRGAYDLVHANFWMSGLVAAALKRLLGIPFVITFHALGRVRRQYQGDADQFPDQRFAIEDSIVEQADAVIAECPQDEQDLMELYHADPARIWMIPAGFDPQEFWPVDKDYARRLLGLDPAERIVLQLGRMVPRKGIESVIRGLGHAAREFDSILRLVVVGGESEAPDPKITPELGRLDQVALEEGITEQVTFVGRRPREVLRYYYSAADIFATLPWYEPFGMTPLEAMGCGTPVIGSKVGGVKFTVVHGETGYLVPPQDPQAFAERLFHLSRSPEMMAKMGHQGLQRARNYFTWHQVARMMADLYLETIDGVDDRWGSLRGRAKVKAAIPHFAEV
jgi:glycosyltransferase involved in cell wall biosynthesis